MNYPCHFVQILRAKCLRNEVHTSHKYVAIVLLLLRQIWIVNYNVKCLSNDLNNVNQNTGVSIIWQNNWYFMIWRSKRTRLMTFYLWEYPCNHPQSATTPKILTFIEKHDRSILWSDYDIAWSSHFIRFR